jgi:hypothetical protein
LAVAELALNKKYELDQSDPAAAVQMLSVELGQGNGPEVMEKWFQRAITADPDCDPACRSKLYYLEPKWHGSLQDELNFGKQCLAARRFREGLPSPWWRPIRRCPSTPTTPTRIFTIRPIPATVQATDLLCRSYFRYRPRIPGIG